MESQTDAGDVSAILSLSKSINGEISLGWKKDTDPCKWPSVQCSENRITHIQIGGRRLKGNVPSEIRNLSSLQQLELQSNSLSGPLPSLSGMPQLRVLFLHNNSFSSIPADFFNDLPALQAVSLDNNPFEVWAVPAGLRGSSVLVNFSANQANLTGVIPAFFGTEFASLEHLGLAYNSLKGGLPSELASSTSLRSIWLNNQAGEKLSGGVEVIEKMGSLIQVNR